MGRTHSASRCCISRLESRPKADRVSRRCCGGPKVRCGSNPEVSDGCENVCSWGQSGHRFRAAGGPLVAKTGSGNPSRLSTPKRQQSALTKSQFLELFYYDAEVGTLGRMRRTLVPTIRLGRVAKRLVALRPRPGLFEQSAKLWENYDCDEQKNRDQNNLKRKR